MNTIHLSPKRLGFIGLGVMGFPMAGHLQQAGHSVTVYNRNTEKAKLWSQRYGGAYALSPKAVAEQSDVVMCCVGNDDDLRAVILGDEGVMQGLAKEGVLVDHTTTSAEVARELAEFAQSQGKHFIDAPVSGGQKGAETGKLTIMCGGDQHIFTLVQPLLQHYAQAVTHMGGAGFGQLTKMVNQICIAGLLQGLSEAIAFGKKAELDMHQVLEVISKGAAQSWQLENRGHTMVDGEFDFGFAVDWMRKDLGLVLDEAKRNGAPLPVTALVDQFYGDVQRLGGQRWDTSSLIKRLV